MPGAPRLQGRMGCGVRKRRGVQAALGTYPGARPLATRWRGFFGTGRSKPHDMGAHLAGQPRGRLLRPECTDHYTARMPTGTTRPTHPPEKSMSRVCTELSPHPRHRRQTTPAPGIPRTGVSQSHMQFLQAELRRPTSLPQPYACVSSLPSTRPSVMAIPMVRPVMGVEYSMAKRPPELLPVAYRLTIGL